MVEADCWEAVRRFARPAPRVSLPLKERGGVPGDCNGEASLPLPAHPACPALQHEARNPAYFKCSARIDMLTKAVGSADPAITSQPAC